MLRRRDLLSALALQKINAAVTFLAPAAALVWLAQVTDTPYLATAVMAVSFGFNGAIYAGHSLNTITIAPQRQAHNTKLSASFHYPCRQVRDGDGAE